MNIDDKFFNVKKYEKRVKRKQWGEIMDMVSAHDRRFFEDNMGCTERVRPCIYGEFMPMSEVHPPHVMVTQIEEGGRTRQGIVLYDDNATRHTWN